MIYDFECKTCERTMQSQHTALEDNLCGAEGVCEGRLIRVWSSHINIQNLKDSH